jgi:hypothetical protein
MMLIQLNQNKFILFLLVLNSKELGVKEYNLDSKYISTDSQFVNVILYLHQLQEM